jgi:CheY-like chemotaxis protein
MAASYDVSETSLYRAWLVHLRAEGVAALRPRRPRAAAGKMELIAAVKARTSNQKAEGVTHGSYVIVGPSGEGTTCYRGDCMAECEGDRKEGDDPDRHGWLIGVVDDNHLIRETLSGIIQSAAYRCSVFSSGKAFLDSDELKDIACLVLDVEMPGLSGLELQVRLRDMKCTIPIVFVTADADDDVRTKAIEQGAVAFLIKPFTEAALLEAICAALRSGPGNRSICAEPGSSGCSAIGREL